MGDRTHRAHPTLFMPSCSPSYADLENGLRFENGVLVVPLGLLRNIDLMLRRPDPEEGQDIVSYRWRAARFLQIRLIQLKCLNLAFQKWRKYVGDQIARHGPLCWDKDYDLQAV